MNDNKVKHLEMIETIIEKMGKNCFQLKTWSITLVTGVLAIAVNMTNNSLIYFSCIALFGFWLLDSFYLQTERKYKLLYKNVASKSEDEIDFNLDTRKVIGNVEETCRLCFCRCVFSVSECCFYPIILIGLLVFSLCFQSQTKDDFCQYCMRFV